MFEKKYHTESISNYSFLITGGAGFIGSNLVEYLIKYNAGKVRVLDNLSNGYYDNIKEFIGLPNFEFIEGDIRDLDTCKNALVNVDFVSHQAALGSVPRSINNPILSNDVNVNGFLNMMVAVKDTPTIRKMVYAASSSTYGDSMKLPKIEGQEGKPLSPYAVTKLVNEIYADVFSKIYGLHTIGLRYFNVFGPKQNPNNPYAAVIPIFCNAILNDIQPIINGDGTTSRDFTFVENVIQANIRAMMDVNLTNHEVFNTACGEQIALNEIISLLNKISGKNVNPIYGQERKGDVKHSLADISKIKNTMGYTPEVFFEQGLSIVYNWYKKKYESKTY